MHDSPKFAVGDRSLPDTTTTIEHPSVLTDIEFVTALHGAIDTLNSDWPIPTNAAQALAVADLYGVDGDCASDSSDPETYTAFHALCILAHGYRQASGPPAGVLERVVYAIDVLAEPSDDRAEDIAQALAALRAAAQRLGA